jgi:GTP pyrophosphokinase
MAKIDQTNVGLDTELKSGQTIEIITDENAKPYPSWLKIVATTKAKTSIKDNLQEESIQILFRVAL